MSKVTLYQCELCKGTKPVEVVKGVVSKCKIDLVHPNALQVETHICITCIERIKNA